MSELLWHGRRDSNDKDERPRISRRNFLTGAASTALTLGALGGVAKIALENDVERQAYDALGIEALITKQEAQERARAFEGVTNSKHFISEIVRLSDEYERELPNVIDFIKTATRKDPEGRNRMDYLREMLYAEGVPEVAMEELKKQIVGLAFQESRYDDTRVSSAKAQGILQIIQSTWHELAEEGEEIHSLVDQTRVAGELLSQTYRHLLHEAGDELESIKREFFNGDDESFQLYFLSPVLINSYNAGMGNMDNVVRWFAYQYPTQKSTIGIYEEKKAVSGHDVFMLMIEKYVEDNPDSSYKKHAQEYTPRVHAAALALLRQDPELFTA